MILNTSKMKEGRHAYTFFGDRTPWVMDCVKEALGEVFRPGEESKVCFRFDLIKSCENITMDGVMKLVLHPECLRCLCVFETPLSLPVKTHLIPASEESEEGAVGELELEAGDVEFCFYRHHEIDLKKILREEMLLNIPDRFLCHLECKGLCPQCGANMNTDSCQCRSPAKDARFAPLEKLKLKS
ncbi:MAG: hypothetical protein A3I75_07850 [Deltaproteobacteria bacterium RIFCSPLOWO2_02_FULL_50_16]|nr:MAG: hypothetical protein A2053_01205 [Deltaproteobacteria bacterium GWA2_50_8]OGQ57663.1 MAG: hypothetical protein A3I75_07850 [Deltaproteobacteria bacterium RIFCSPLOWO2_02_FULL_50_16]OGQ67878.1 MAG: hypothetical protein A3F89_06900 [Deltaproteobacteria bacterium RIFCSPLOWO2_12_FULL_50_11]